MTLLGDADPFGVALSCSFLVVVAASVREAGWALHEGSHLLESLGIQVQSPAVLIASAAVLMLTGIAAAWLTCTVIRSGWPPGVVATCGLLLIVVHGASRGAGFLHLPRTDWTEWGTPTPLRAVEAVGLALVIVGILRWGRARQPADSQPRRDAI